MYIQFVEEANHCGHVSPPSLKLCLFSELKIPPLTLLTLPFSCNVFSFKHSLFNVYVQSRAFVFVFPLLSSTFLCNFAVSEQNPCSNFAQSFNGLALFSNDLTLDWALTAIFIKFPLASCEYQLPFSSLIVKFFGCPFDFAPLVMLWSFLMLWLLGLWCLILLCSVLLLFPWSTIWFAAVLFTVFPYYLPWFVFFSKVS